MREEVLYVIFMDLNKAFDALDRDIFLEILLGYRVGPWACHILREYWYIIWMIEHTGG